MDNLDRAERWLYDELISYKVAENVNGAPLNESQREARDAIKTAFDCVQKVKADKKRMVDKFWEEDVKNG